MSKIEYIITIGTPIIIHKTYDNNIKIIINNANRKGNHIGQDIINKIIINISNILDYNKVELGYRRECQLDSYY